MNEKWLYPGNACPGCDRKEAVEELPMTNTPLMQCVIHVPSETLCFKFVPPEAIANGSKAMYGPVRER
jgi:hypothetical protein